MCDRCDHLDETMARYRRLKAQVNDEKTLEGLERLLGRLEAAKRALHPEE
jgi:hypothetical protein